MRKTRLRLRTEATVFSAGRQRAVHVEFAPSNPDLIQLRLEGTRRRYPVDLSKLFVRVVEWTVAAERIAKKKAKKAAKG